MRAKKRQLGGDVPLQRYNIIYKPVEKIKLLPYPPLAFKTKRIKEVALF